MCGIVGWVGRPQGLAEGALEAALAALAPRGPDGAGSATGRVGRHPVVLGVRRLDLVAPGVAAQPAHRPGGAALVLNGEIYEHESLRRSLEAEEHETFGTHGDAEVLAALLQRRGVGGLGGLEGSWAFAFLWGEGGPVWLSRDPQGVRPLFIARRPGGVLFASTLTALTATGAVPREANPHAVRDLLRDGVVGPGRSALMGVDPVPPGAVLEIGPDLGVRTLEVPQRPDEEPPDVLAALRAAVAARMRSPRPAAVFLSGGTDSAIVAALAREHSDHLAAFTATFPGHGDVDEAPRARRTARKLGIEHVEVPLPRDPFPWVLGASRAFDEPFADPSGVATWGLACAAGRRARIALTGTGGDETFGGYRRYWLLGAGPWLRHLPRAVRLPAALVLERASPGAAKLLRAAGDAEGLYRGLLRLDPSDVAEGLLGERLRGLGPEVLSPGPRTPSEAMADDLRRYLPQDLLVKEDRALMAHGVEGRHPFLDRRVRAAAARLEHRGTPGRGRQKQVLRAFVREVVDPDLSRVPKHGFAFPVDPLYRGPLQPLAEEVVHSRALGERGFVAPLAARRLLHHHLSGGRDLGNLLHAVVMLELWARHHLDR